MEERFKKDIEDFQNAESRIMGEFKGTKGEWCIRKYTVGEYIKINITTDYGHVISILSKEDEPVFDEIISMANAQLMATAPKLLVELYQMTLLLKALPENDSEMRERIESAEKAINKALGL